MVDSYLWHELGFLVLLFQTSLRWKYVYVHIILTHTIWFQIDTKDSPGTYAYRFRVWLWYVSIVHLFNKTKRNENVFMWPWSVHILSLPNSTFSR